jgi:dTDP-4-dehydrorhamnose reductase
MTDILLISPDGMLGRAFSALLTSRKLAFETVSYPAFDIANPDHVQRALHPQLRWVINCSGYTDVDGAETHEGDADAVNATGVQLLAARCRANGTLFVHFSTDYVFDGNAKSPYPVTHPQKPQGAYGRSKARGEAAVVASGCEHLVIRTSWLYAPWGKNFVDTMVKFGREKPVLRVVNDQRGRPTSAQYLAERSLELIEHQARGIFHVTDGGECTWFEFAQRIVAQSGGSARVDPCTSAEYVRAAVRPAYSVLDLSTTEALLGPSRSWQQNLDAVLQSRR